MKAGRASRESGTILFEVLVAVVLIGLVVGPLATALSGVIGQARTLREEGAGQAASDGASGNRLEGWGPRVTEASWNPGPVLRLSTDLAGSGDGVDARVGIWVDGWSVGEVPLGADDGQAAAPVEVTVPASVWSGRAGGEVVLRVSSGTGGWGPPWRSAVPGLDGGAPDIGMAAVEESLQPTAVVHRTGTGTTKLTVSWSIAPLAVPPFPLLFPVMASVQGWGGVALEGGTQWWRMEEARSVDVYY